MEAEYIKKTTGIRTKRNHIHSATSATSRNIESTGNLRQAAFCMAVKKAHIISTLIHGRVNALPESGRRQRRDLVAWLEFTMLIN